MRWFRFSSRQSQNKKTRARQVRPLLEILEDRTLLSGGQWLAVFDGVTPADTIADQIQTGASLLQNAGIAVEDVQVVNAFDLSGSFLVQTPTNIDQPTLTNELQAVPGFDFVQDYTTPGTPDQPFVPLDASEARSRPDPLFGPFAPADALVNNNTGSTGTAYYTQGNPSLVAFNNEAVVAYFDSDSAAASPHQQFDGVAYSTNVSQATPTFTDTGALPSSTNGDAGDPMLARNNTTGAIYLSTLQYTGAGVNVFKSTNNGMTWSAPVQGAPGKSGLQDKPWMTVDNFSGTGNGNIYLAERDFGAGNGIYFFSSTNGGSTFGPSGGTLIASGGQGANIVVGPDHSVYVFWYAGSTLEMRKSTNQGASFGAPVVVASGLATSVNGDLGIVGQDNGVSSTQPIRSNSFPQAAVNPVTGSLYVTYNNDGAGTDKADVFLVTSNNGGAAWSAPLKVNDDSTTTDQWDPTIAVTPDGARVGIFYLSRQIDTTADNKFELYSRIGSINGATITFAPSTAVSTVASLPEVGRDSVVDPTFMSDDIQAVATPGAFDVAWSDNVTPLAGGGSRMDPNVEFQQITVPFAVTTTVPAVGSDVSSRLTSFTVNVTQSINAATLQASAFKVNGISATSDSYTPSSTTITFNFATSPITTAQGPQTMTIAAGAFDRSIDNSPVAAFSGTFYYDVTPLAVSSTTPTEGTGILTAPGTMNLTLNFNSAFNPSTLHASDLVVSGLPGLVVSSATAGAGNTSATFAITGAEQDGTLTASLAAGILSDTFGNPSVAFSSSYAVQVSTVPFPAPFTAVTPLGSLIYTASTTGAIVVSGHSDSYTFALDAVPVQNVSVIVTGTSSGFVPTLKLVGPTGMVGSGFAVFGTQEVALQGFEALDAGTYTLVIGGNTTGTYSVQVVLNALIQTGSNTSTSGALFLNESQVSEVNSEYDVQRYAAVGNIVAASGPESRYFRMSLSAGEDTTIGLENLSGSATLTLQGPAGTIVASGGATNLSQVISNFVAPSAGTYYVVVTGSVPTSFSLVVTLNALFDTDPNSTMATAQSFGNLAAAEGYVTSAPTPTTIDSFEFGLFNYTFTGSDRAFTTSLAKHDGTAGLELGSVTNWMYRTDAAAQLQQGQTISWWVQIVGSPSAGQLNLGFGASAGGTLSLVVDGATGQLLFQDNDRFGATTIGTPVSQTWQGNQWYRVQVVWGVGGALTGQLFASDGVTLLNTVTAFNTNIQSGGIAFQDTGFTSYVDTVETLPPGAENDDWYAINVPTTTNALNLAVTVPADGPNLFVNNLSPGLNLYDPSGNLVASASTGPGTSLSYLPTVTGTFYVQVVGEYSTSGEYLLTDNFSPNITSLTATPTIENGTSTATVNFTDPGIPDSHLVQFEWGDGSDSGPFFVPVGVLTYTATHQYLDEPAGGDSYAVTAFVSDSHDANANATTTAIVTDPSVVALGGFTFTTTENPAGANISGAVATFTDPGGPEGLGDYSAMINWGDGTATPGTISGPDANGNFTVSGSHAYVGDTIDGQSEGVANITVTISHDLATPTLVNDAATVSDPSVVATGNPIIATEGASTGSVLLATFTDPGGPEGLGDYSADISWGDGTATQVGAGVITVSGSTFSVYGSYTYAEESGSSPYQITVSINHDLATPTLVYDSATVSDAAVTATATPVTTAVYATPFTGEVATFTDANPGATTADFPPGAVTILWGDGSTSNATAVQQIGTAFHVFGNHTYLAAGATTNPLMVTITDVGGAVSNTTSYTPTVATADLYVTANANSKTYGAIAGDTGAISGVLNNDGITATFSSSGDAATASVAGSPYLITATLSDPNNALGNYTVHETDANLTVNPADLYVTATANSKTYGAIASDTGAVSGVLNNDGISATFSSSGDGATASVAGSPYLITATLSDPNNALGNYTVHDTDANLTVNPADLYVTASANSKTYGSIASDTGAVSGVLNNDGITATFASAGDGASASVAGSPYLITATLSDPNNELGNYTVHETDANLTVHQATPTVVASDAGGVYTSNPFTATATVTGVGSDGTLASANLDSATLSFSYYAGSSVSGSALGGALTDPGTYTVVAHYTSDNTNYTNADGAPVTFTITAVGESISGDVVVLNQTASGALTISGNAQLNVAGTLQVDSGSASAVVLSGNSDVDAAQTLIVGGAQVSGNANFSHGPTTGAAYVADPLAVLTAATGGASYAAVNLAGGNTLTINPGIYPSITVSGNAHLSLNPGIYIIGSGGVTVSSNGVVTGGTATGGVLIYNNGGLTVTGKASVNLTAFSTGDYAGVAIFQAPTDAGAVTVSGNANLNLNGGFLYDANVQSVVTISGNAQIEASMVVNELTISGNSDDTAP